MYTWRLPFVQIEVGGETKFMTPMHEAAFGTKGAKVRLSYNFVKDRTTIFVKEKTSRKSTIRQFTYRAPKA